MWEPLIPIAVAAATGFSVLIRGLYTRVHDLDNRVDAFELRVAENYVSKESFASAFERVEAHMIRIEENRQTIMIKILRPILFAFLASDAVKELVVDLLSAYAARTDNEVDDYAVDLIRRELGVEKEKA